MCTRLLIVILFSERLACLADISTERLYEAFPVAQEDIKLSLLVSLVGGVLGGTAAACVSNPADAVISELKKSKSDITPQEAVSSMLERNGISTFFVGLPVRIVFYSLVSSLTFAVYDFLRSTSWTRRSQTLS